MSDEDKLKFPVVAPPTDGDEVYGARIRAATEDAAAVEREVAAYRVHLLALRQVTNLDAAKRALHDDKDSMCALFSNLFIL
jgi:hypothetical protein